MKNLGRHIEALLHDGDCVIVPELGGFIAHTMHASYAEDEQFFFPPFRTVSFNARLTTNDGMLAARYMHEYHISYTEAMHQISIAVDKIHNALSTDGYAVLQGVGRLNLGIQGIVTFEAEEPSIGTPNLFGLEVLRISPFSTTQSTTIRLRQDGSSSSNATRMHAALRPLRTIAEAAAVALLLLVFSLPIVDGRMTNVAGLPGLPSRVFTEISGLDIDAPVALPSICREALSENHQEAEDVPSEAVLPTYSETEIATEVESANTTDTDAEEAANENIEKEEIVAPSPTYYHLIVASLANINGAEDLKNKYIQMGYPDTKIVEKDGRVRISIMSFADKAEANAHIDDFRAKNLFKGIWLCPVK